MSDKLVCGILFVCCTFILFLLLCLIMSFITISRIHIIELILLTWFIGCLIIGACKFFDRTGIPGGSKGKDLAYNVYEVVSWPYNIVNYLKISTAT